MAEKRLLYFITGEVQLFRWRAGRLAPEAVYPNSEVGVAAFAKHLQSSPRALYYMLADVVEEDFHFEAVPLVRGKDRRAMLGRKLAQRYRDLSLALTLPLGYESGTRREEKILFSSFTNTQQFQPWLAALRSSEARLAGVYSLPLISPLVGRRIGVAAKRYLLVSLQQGGLRQSFIDNGQIRFSRLGRLDSASPEDVARASALESVQIQQYLLNTRILARDAGPLDVVLLAPADQLDLYRKACASTAQLQFRVLDREAACRKAGLRRAPGNLLGERLFLHVLASSQPAVQFADDVERRFYHLWRARVALVSAGAAVFLFCALVAALRLVDAFSIDQLAAIDRAQEARLADQYARLQAQFPKTPTSTDNLKALVKNYQVVQQQTASLDGILREISQALALAPQLDIDRIDWHIGADPRKGGPPAAAKAAPGARPGADKAEKSLTDASYQVVEISGRVNVVQASDYRNITLVVNQFVQTLRQRPGMEVFSAQLPFDLNAEKSLSGDIGTERATQVPRFTVVAARRLGA